MDQQTSSTFKGVMLAAACIAGIGAAGYGIYYASQADERRQDSFQQSLDDLRCSTERIQAYSNNRTLSAGNPCR